MNTKSLFVVSVLVSASLMACGKNDGTESPTQNGSQVSTQNPAPTVAQKPAKAVEALPGGVRPSFPYSVSSGRSVKNEDGSVNRIQRVIFRRVSPSAAAADLKAGYRKLGYTVADAGSGAEKATYVARRADMRIRYVIVPGDQGQKGAKGMVTFYWQE